MQSIPVTPGVGAAAVFAGNRPNVAEVNARIDRLPATRAVWFMVFLVSIGGWFEFYDLFFTAYVGPGLVRSGMYSTTTAQFFGFSGLGSFVAASFAGLFIGTVFFSGLADRYGRRRIFTASLLWYSAATFIMAFQSSAASINIWRLIAGIGVGIELVVIDTYVSELVPTAIRGRAFALIHLVQYTAVPAVALLAWWFEPRPYMSLSGWRWVVLIGAAGAVVVWFIRLRLPESPRWLVQRGHADQAEVILRRLEIAVEKQSGRPLPVPVISDKVAAPEPKAHFREIWQPPYRRRTLTMLVFNLFQSLGFYGFASWVPTLLLARGVTVTHSLMYSFVIAISNPIGPLISMTIADRVQRKTMIIFAAAGVALFGSLFATQSTAAMLITLGILLTLCNTMLSVAYHTYQTELFPTRIRARAVGMVYSISRLSAMFSGFIIAFALRDFGTAGVFTLITAAMVVVMLAIGFFGPRTNNRSLDEISQ